MQPDLRLIECDWLLVGFRGKCFERSNMISLCRLFGCRVVFREGEVMVIEVGACSRAIDDLLARLPRTGCVTHLWRSGQTVRVPGTVVPLDPKFCGIKK